MMNGWIKLHRQLLSSDVFSNPKVLKVWIWCLLKASSKPYDAIIGLQTVHLEEGQFVFGLIKASEELDIPARSLRRYLDVLQEHGMVAIKTTNKYSILTVKNWGFYQGSGNGKSEGVANKCQTNANIQEGKEYISKRPFGSFRNVMLSDDDYEALKNQFPDDYRERIEELSSYMKSKGKDNEYANHYATIVSWANKNRSGKKERR